MQYGEIVSREQLRQALWPEGTHVNFEGSLNAALKKLRAALQDDAENPRFIETVPRQGYRFLAPVHVINGGPAPSARTNHPAGNGEKSIEVRLRMHPEFSPESSTSESEWDRQRAERTQRWFDTMLLAVAILFGSWFLFFIVYPVPRPSVQRMTRIANASRIDEWGGIVSDGTRIFFLEHEAGHWKLMQTSVEGGNAEVMAAPFENTRLFAISPDHSQFLIGQFVRRDDEMPLWLWPVQGGEPRRLGQATGHDPAWSPDGTQIVFVRGQNLYSIHRDGTQAYQLLHVDGNPHAPAWSPDGQTIRFTVDQGEFGNQRIWQVSADGNGARPLLTGERSRRTSLPETGPRTADISYSQAVNSTNVTCGPCEMRGVGSGVRTTMPFPLTNGPDVLHVAIPTQMGSRIFAFSFRSTPRTRKNRSS